jgi:hypothetical protein
MSTKETILKKLAEAKTALEEAAWATGEVHKKLDDKDVDINAAKETLGHIVAALDELREGFRQVADELGR